LTVGIDVVEVARFATALGRTQRLAIRLFAERERDLPMRSLAAGRRVVIAEGGAD
jgi:holo-[acyl-carrier protein] synthase